MTDLPAFVTVREVCLRDGLQLEDPIPLSAKLELLEAIVATGVKEVEATAFVSPSKVPALADAPEVAAALSAFPDVEFSALVAGPGGAGRALAAHLRARIAPSLADITAAPPIENPATQGEAIRISLLWVTPQPTHRNDPWYLSEDGQRRAPPGRCCRASHSRRGA